MAEERLLHPVDYAVLAVVLTISLGIGLYHALTGGKQRTTKEFLLADRNLKVLPVAMSLFVSGFSAIYVLGTSAEMYQYGVQLYMGVFGNMLGCILCAIILVPLFYPLKFTSVFEYIDWRFHSPALRVILSLVLISSQITYMGVAMFAPATALEAVTKFPVWATIIICGIVTTMYTSLGGMKAVIWTDVFQCIVMLAGILSILIIGAVRVGGLTKVWQVAYRGNRINFFNFNLDPTVRLSFWPCIFGNALYSLASYGTSQVYIQRFTALPTVRAGQLSILLSVVFYAVFGTVVCLCGLVLFAYYDTQGCDPLRGGLIQNSNQLLPHFVVNVLGYPGVPGLFVSVLFSGALSSVSSSLNAISAVAWKDLLEPYLKHISEGRKVLVTKLLVVFFGILGTGMAFFSSILPGHVMTISRRLTGALSSPIEGMFTLGSFFPCANRIGAFFGSFACIFMTSWINIGAYLTRPHREYLMTNVSSCNFTLNTTAVPMPTDPPNVFWLYRVSFMWVTSIGSVVCIVTGLVVSIIFKSCADTGIPDSRLMVPVFDRFICCLPETIQKFLWCGVDYENLPMGDFSKSQTKEQVADKTSVNEYWNTEPKKQSIPLDIRRISSHLSVSEETQFTQL